MERDPDPTSSELCAVLARVAGGDELALRQLYETTRRRLYGIVLAVVGRRGVADEVLVETFVQIWHEAGRFDSRRGSALAWLAMLARSRAVDRLRARGTRKELLLGTEQLDGFVSQAPGPLQHSLGEERAGIVRSALLALPQEQRRAIAAAFFRGLTHQEAAEALDVPLGTIKTRIRTGLTALRRALSVEGGPHESGQEGVA